MVKVVAREFNKDDRDYRRFFQSRNVSLPVFKKYNQWDNSSKTSGVKHSITEKDFFPIIARKMTQRA